MYENSIPLQQFENQYQQLLAKYSGEVSAPNQLLQYFLKYA